MSLVSLARKEAIDSFPKEPRVAVIASGGLSHFVVDEDLDQKFLAFMQKGDVVDYVPCYRSSAGTGNAMGFVRWM